MRAASALAFLLTVSLLAPLAPGAAAEPVGPTAPTPTTLYFHIFDTFNKFVINTQPYNASFFEVGGTNFPSQGLIEQSVQDHNTIYGVSTSGPVEYDFIEAGRPRMHPERGIAQDVKLDVNTKPMVYLYFDPRGIFGADESPGFLPLMTFRAQMREGDQIGSDLDAGDLIMHGEASAYLVDASVQPTDAAGIALLVVNSCPTPQPTVPPSVNQTECPKVDANGNLPRGQGVGDAPVLVPDAAGVVEVAIPMEFDGDGTITKADAYNIRLDWYQDPNGAFGPDQVAQGNLRVVLDKDHLPRLEVSVLNPIYISAVHPQVAAGTLLVHTAFNSPWGTYDADDGNVRLTVEGPSQPAELRTVKVTNKHRHGAHNQDAAVTYLWDFRAEGAKDGEYTLHFEVPNLKGNAVARQSAQLVVKDDTTYTRDEQGHLVELPDAEAPGGKGSPTLGLAAALGLLAAAGALRRRSA